MKKIWERKREETEYMNRPYVICHILGSLDGKINGPFMEAVPLSYRAYLRERGVSYILAGKTELDCKLAMEKLYRLFSIKKLLICGGGAADWTFLQAGMVDELSLVLSPVTDGSSGTASVFAQFPVLSTGEPVEFDLKAAERIGSGGLHLKYLAKNAEDTLDRK